MNNELNSVIGPLTQAAQQALPGDMTKQQGRNPINVLKRTMQNESVQGFALGGVIRSGNSFAQDLSAPQPPTNPLTSNALVKRDKHGNDMTFTNQMKARLGEAPVGTTPASPNPLASVSPQPPAGPASIMRDQYGNDMTFTNSMKKQLGEPAVGEPSPGQNPLTAPTNAAATNVAASPATPSAPVASQNTTPPETESSPFSAIRGFAGGGTVETPEQLMARMAAKYGSTGSAQAQPAAAPAPTPQPQPVVAQAPERARGIFNIMKTRGEQIDKASGYASGGKISGPGTPTSDSIPAVVQETGEPIKVSTNERILSHAQDQLMEGVAKELGFSSLDKMLEAGTGKPVGPTVRAGKIGAAGGASPNVLAELDSDTHTPGAPNASPGPAASANPLATIDMRANNDSLARANAIRESIAVGDNTGPKVTMLENSGLKESQDLMDKWGRQDAQREMMQEMGRNPRAASALAGLHAAGVNNEAQMRGQDVAATVNQRNNDTTQRGQDITAQTERRGQDVNAQSVSAKLAGNPLTNALTQAKIDSERVSADKTRRQSDVLAQLERETNPTKRETLIENALVAQGKSPQQGERLTLEQMRTNWEIHAARKTIADLSPEDLRRKTAKQTNTGRENPDFDPGLERAVSLAGRRKIGADDEFDQRQAQVGDPAAQPAGDVATRFTADPAMKNHRLGKQTDLGTEVFDAAGKLIGHYQ